MRPQEGIAVALLINMSGLARPTKEPPILLVARRIAEIASPSSTGGGH
jgi:hypothetical protein